MPDTEMAGPHQEVEVEKEVELLTLNNTARDHKEFNRLTAQLQYEDCHLMIIVIK